MMRMIMFAAIIMLFLTLCSNSVTYTLAQSTPKETQPLPLGKLIDVGGHKMHIYCIGSGSPAVILEAGAGAFSLDWDLVQTEVAKFTSVCSYDRGGHAWSELGPKPRTMKQAIYDLHRLLLKAGVPGPYVLVGHSLGGMLVRVYATQYPDEVAGIVLVDSASENNLMFIDGRWVRWFAEAKPRQIPAVQDQITESDRSLDKAEMEGFENFRKMVGPPQIEPPYDKLSPHLQELRLWAMSQPESVVTDYNPFGAEELVLLFADRIRQEFPLGNKPLIVLTRKLDTTITNEDAKRREEERVENEKDLTTLSRNSLLVFAEKSGHEIHLYEPDLVVQAIQAVLEAVQTGSTLKPFSR